VNWQILNVNMTNYHEENLYSGLLFSFIDINNKDAFFFKLQLLKPIYVPALVLIPPQMFSLPTCHNTGYEYET
jgi:hypothetical protein